MTLLAVAAWALVGLGLVVDLGNLWMLFVNLGRQRYQSVVPLVPVIFYAMGAAVLSATAHLLPSVYGRILMALIVLHACVWLAHMAVGDRRPPRQAHSEEPFHPSP